MTTQIKIVSWNINGVRAACRKGLVDWILEEQPDIVCFQETRAEAEQVPARLAELADYTGFWNASKDRRGYAGTAVLSRVGSPDVTFGLGVERFDREGRTVVARFPDFTLVNCYFPNGSRDHSRVPFKLEFYDAFLEMVERLRADGENLIFCGDVNTAHREIDLARPQSNRGTTGFLPEERAWLDRVIATGYVDTFRRRHSELPDQYTWWSVPTRARERNVGWRIDYFFAAAEILDRVDDAFILPDVSGSDHCPVGITLRAVTLH